MNKIFNELEKYCDKHSIKLQIDKFPKDKNRFEITLDNFTFEELNDVRKIIRDFAKIEDDVHLAGNGRAIDIYIEDLNESKSMKESVDGKFATDKECNMGGKGWILEGTYNFIMEFLEEWGIAPTDVIPQKHDMNVLYNADGNVFGYCHHDDEVDIFVVDKDINYFWKNYKPSTKRVKVTEMDDNWY